MGRSIVGVRKGEIVEFLATDGLKQYGFLYEGNAKRCMIHIHGMTGNFYGSEMPPIISKHVAKDYSLFSINTRGHDGLSGFHRVIRGKDTGRAWIGTNLERFEESVRDVAGAIKAMSELGFKEFVVSGHSTGCQKAAYYQYKTRDKRVKALVLLAPADDYNVNRMELGKEWQDEVRRAERLIAKRKGNTFLDANKRKFSAQRFMSVASTKRVESRLFNYDGQLREFASITIPIYAMFGSEEENAPKQVAECLALLEHRTRSRKFTPALVEGAGHSFYGYEDKVGKLVADWLASL